MKKNIRIKPSKSSSVMGFVVGIIFVFIGLFVAIPTAGLFGVLWTGIAVFITITNAMNAFGDKGVATEVIEIESEDDMSRFDSRLNDIDRYKDEKDVEFYKKLTMLNELKEEGILTEEEFEKKKQEILNQKW